MRNLSVMEQKQVVGGGYYYKVFTLNGRFVYKSRYYFDYEEQACVDDMMAHVNSLGYDYCGVMYDNETGNIEFRW